MHQYFINQQLELIVLKKDIQFHLNRVYGFNQASFTHLTLHAETAAIMTCSLLGVAYG